MVLFPLPLFLQHNHQSFYASYKKNTSFQEEASVDFLSWESKQIHTEPKDRHSTVVDANYEFPMNQSHDRLVAGGPKSIPRAIERIRDGRAQHIVQIHLCGLGEGGEKDGSTIFTATNLFTQLP